MQQRMRHGRRWRFAVEVAAAVVCVAAGPHVVSALASTGEAPPPDTRPPRRPDPARQLAALLASLPTPPPAHSGLSDAAPDALSSDALSPEAARLQNAAIPISDAPNPAARPYSLEGAGALQEARATDCMAAAVYYEAGGESLDGQRAVAQVVLNRLRDPQFPKTVCEVVFEGSGRPGCQFTFTCDGSLDRPPTEGGWAQARKVAQAALHGYVMKAVGGATRYHADYVAPGWSPAMAKVAVVGQHIFYRWPQGVRAPAAPGPLRVASLDEPPADLGKLPLTPVPQEPAPAPEVAAPPAQIAAATRPVAAIEAAGDKMADAGAVAAEAGPVLMPGQLDWQGRPRDQGPPRLARPDTF